MNPIGVNPYSAMQTAKVSDAKPTTAEAGRNVVSDGAADFRVALQAAEETAMQTALTGADPHAMVQALANAEMMLETAVTVRDKVVEAYQELLRMPV